MKVVDYKGRELKVGERVCVQQDVPSVDGMLYKNSIVRIDEFNVESNKMRVVDSLGKIWWVEPSLVSASFL
tara:strand:+ start:126 stop:338 length:213 start_codon:yes stop_codon:yes gene_type:complete